LSQLASLCHIGWIYLPTPYRLLELRDLRRGLRVGVPETGEELPGSLYVSGLRLQHTEFKKTLAVSGIASKQPLECLQGEIVSVTPLPVATAFEQDLLGRGHTFPCSR